MTQDILTTYIEDKRVAPSFAERLTALDEGVGEIVGELITAVNPSENTLRGYITLAEEIAARDELELSRVLGSDSIRQILTAEELSRKERQKQIRHCLESLRYPTIARYKEELATCQAELVRSTGIRVEYPADLEGDVMTVTVRLKNASEFRNAGEKLIDVSDSAQLNKMFALLRGEE